MFSKDFDVFMAKLPQAPDSSFEMLLKDESISEITTTFRNNPESGLGLLFRNLYNPMCNYAVRLLYSDQLAETVVSEVFFQFFRTKAFKTVHSGYVNYLFKLVVNECFNHLYYQNENLRTFHFRKGFSTDFHSVPKDHYNNFSLRVAEVMAQLNTQRQKIFSMIWFQNNSYFEIGQQLNISPKTVEIHILNVIGKFAERPHQSSKLEDTRHFNSQSLISNELINIDTSFRARIVNIKRSKFEKVFAIDKKAKLAVYKQLVICILKALYDKVIEDGNRMPSINKISVFLIISQLDVQKAFYDLKKIGILTPIRGNGYFITMHACWSNNETLKNFQTLTNENYELMTRNMCNKVSGLSFSEINKQSKQGN